MAQGGRGNSSCGLLAEPIGKQIRTGSLHQRPCPVQNLQCTTTQRDPVRGTSTFIEPARSYDRKVTCDRKIPYYRTITHQPYPVPAFSGSPSLLMCRGIGWFKLDRSGYGLWDFGMMWTSSFYPSIGLSTKPGELQSQRMRKDRGWPHEFRAKPDDLRMITVDGDSMEPLLSSGDRILIDVSRQVPVPPGIFVIWDGMGLVAKRIEHVPHSEPPRVVLKSLNPEYDSYERLAEEVRLVGRAVWVSPGGCRVARHPTSPKRSTLSQCVGNWDGEGPDGRLTDVGRRLSAPRGKWKSPSRRELEN